MMIKVCGLKEPEDILMCDFLGVDFLGFIFFKKSPRCVDVPVIYDLLPLKAKLVGVFVDMDPDEILRLVKEIGLDFVQLHGDYSPEDCLKLGKDRVIKVFWPKRYSSFEDFQDELFKYREVCSYFLIDSGKSLGGHGEVVKCEWLKRVSFPKNWFLAGGVGVDNVLALVDEYRPHGVDINSSVELWPGKKDISLISEILKLLKRG